MTGEADPTIIRRGRPVEREPSEAVLLIDKPKGWTSFDVIRRLRRLLGVRKIGHAGTLDPMATGLLICCVGRATKRVSGFMGLDKRYTGTIRLGQRTPSYDAETEVSEVASTADVTPDRLDDAMQALTGTLEQVPPMYSAVKVDGERLYKKARRGQTVERAPRTIRVDRFERTALRDDDVDFVAECSKGTYVRGLARDLGDTLGCGAHLTALRRTAIGPYSVDEAWRLDELAEALDGLDTNQSS